MKLSTSILRATVALSCSVSLAEAKAHQARSVCQAALDVAEDSYDKISSIVAVATMWGGLSITVDNLEHPALVKELKSRLKNVHRWDFPKQHVPTKVLKMKLSESTRLQAIEDMKRTETIQENMNQILGRQDALGQRYTPFRLEFDPAVLFVPGCIEFMSDNRDLIRKEFPEVHTCQCNAFTVKKGATPFGFHRASALGYEANELNGRHWMRPEYHMSFHTALSPTNDSTSPLVMFDGLMPSVFNDGYMLQHFVQEKEWRPDLVNLAKAALLALTYTAFSERYTLLQFAWAVYYASCTCQDEATSSFGTAWELESGEALFFNNYRMHSDHKFGTNDHDRHTLDLRCYGKVETPWPFQDESDFLANVVPDHARMQEAAVKCMIRLFDYTDEADFYSFISVQPKKRLSYALGSVLSTYANAGDHGLLSEAMEEGMQKHARRVRKMYNEGSLNYTAFEECVNENADALNATQPEDGIVALIRWLLAGLVAAGPVGALTRIVKLPVLGIRLVLGETGERLGLIFACVALVVYVGMGGKSTNMKKKKEE